MKRISIVSMLCIVVSIAFSQPGEERNVELSLSGSYQNYSSGGSASSGALFINPRIGFFVAGGLELEPEVSLMIGSGDAVYIFTGNVSYNFLGGKSVPFILLGYGIANTVPYFNVPLFKSDFAVGVLNAGVGAKAFLVENVALRFEYRYQQYSGEGKRQGYGSFFFTQKIETRIHAVQFGLSVLL